MNTDNRDDGGWIEQRVTPSRFIMLVIAGIAMLVTGYWLTTLPQIKLKFAGVVLLILGPFYILKPLRWLLNGGVAFKYGPQGLVVYGMLGTRRVKWNEVSKVYLHVVTRYALGFIKMGSHRSLMVKPQFGSAIFVPTQMAGVSSSDMEQLGGVFEGLRRSAGAHLGVQDDANPGFDADAVVARYMARNALEGERPSPAATAGSRTIPSGAGSFGKRRI